MTGISWVPFLIMGGIFLLFALFFFLLMRQVMLWYFRIPERIELQQKILAELEEANARRGG